MASNENVIFERRVANLESQLKIARQQPLTMQQLYGGPQDVREDAEDEIDSAGK